jgi:hypothetical protein
MVDNVTITAGVGTSIATDDINGVQYQRVKISQGADGSATDVSSAAPLNVTLANTGANATAVKVDNSAVTQPISAAALPLPSGAATSAKQPALGTAGSASSDVLTIQGIASMTAVKVDGSAVTQPVSISGNQAVNVAQVAGTTADTNSGNKSAGTLRVVLATDQPALTNKLLVTPDANSAVNISQMNGVTVTMGNGVAGTGVQRVAIASDNTVLPATGAGATGSAVPANAAYTGALAQTALPSAATAGNLVGALSDKFGRQVVHLAGMRDLVGTQTTTISASTSETTIITAGAAGVFNDLVMLIVSNTSSSTNTRIDIRDATSGSVIFSIQSNGGQPPVGFVLPVPIPQTTAANNWTAQCATSTTDVRIYAVFVKNK